MVCDGASADKRPHRSEYRQLPDYLYYDKDNQAYRFMLTIEKKKDLGKDYTVAIAIAREYNNLMRPEKAVSVNSLLRESGGVQGEARPLSVYVDKLLGWTIEDERPAEDTLADWRNDAIRMKEFFKDIPACDIELEHVNNYILQYHADSSANVQNRKISFLKKSLAMLLMNR